MNADTIILGLGAMGASAAAHLARRDRRVLAIDQFPIAHTRGSSHGHSRMIRMCYSEHPDYVPLLRRAYELWRDLERESGESLLHITGGVYLGREPSETISGARRAAIDHDLPHELLNARARRDRFPQFLAPDDYVALVEPSAGWLAPERSIRAMAALAARHGAAIHTGERLLEWSADSGGLNVRTDRAEYRAADLIIAAGAWTSPLLARVDRRSAAVLPDLGIPISPTRQVLGWFTPRDPAPFSSPTSPVWAMDDPSSGDLFYGFPLATGADSPTGAPTVKVARHAPGPPIDPDRDTRDPIAADEQDIRPFLREHLSAADGPLAALRICMYENSPDGHFIIDRHPHHPNVLIAAGFSGHGFKFATVIGEVLADLATRGKTDHPIDFLSLRRFSQAE